MRTLRIIFAAIVVSFAILAYWHDLTTEGEKILPNEKLDNRVILER